MLFAPHLRFLFLTFGTFFFKLFLFCTLPFGLHFVWSFVFCSFLFLDYGFLYQSSPFVLLSACLCASCFCFPFASTATAQIFIYSSKRSQNFSSGCKMFSLLWFMTTFPLAVYCASKYAVLRCKHYSSPSSPYSFIEYRVTDDKTKK